MKPLAILLLLVASGCQGGERVEPAVTVELLPGVESGAFLAPDLLAELRSSAPAISNRAFLGLGLFPSPPSPRTGTGGWQVDRGRNLLALSSSGTLVLPLDLPPDPVSLELELRAKGTPGAAWSFRLAMLSIGGQRHDLLEVDQTSDRGGWIRHQLSLEGLGGGDRFLIFESVIEQPAAQIVLRSLQLSHRATAAGDPSAPAVEPGERRRPDVVVIVLDAARADHFGAYGYPRDTTPHIDRFARESLVMSGAFAECCATICSVPNMITGWSVFAFPQQASYRVDPRIGTLAEALQQAGHRTVAFLANPNASSDSMRRGFDEYYLTWELRKKIRGQKGIDPHFLSREAARAIAEAPPQEPLFLLLHYVPPHEPYSPTPAEEFDIFGDSGYRGPVSPGMPMRPIRIRSLELTEADLAELVSHYDGNLRMVDDAVNLVFDALKSAGRFDDAVVLVTSDHGEAFFEHGAQGHNNTLYDEMFHVPFILKMPASELSGRRDRLVSLADIVPTILGRLGLPVDPLAHGVDLLSSEDEAERVLFLRKPGLYEFAVRTRRFKAILHTAGDRNLPPRLLDLMRDPGEQRNIVGQHPLLFVGMALLLEQHMSGLRQSNLQSEAPERSAEELETLRALGYL